MKKIMQLLHTGNYSCVVASRGDVRTFTKAGIADLYDLLKDEPDFLKRALVADKVVGKAAAALMILGGVKEIYTDLISEPAIDLLSETNIEFEYKESVLGIKNRDETDWCPLEKLVFEEKSVENMLLLIDDFIAKMRADKGSE